MNKNLKAQSAGLQKVFTFAKTRQPVRVEIINNETWFVAKDVCDVLGLENVTKALYGVDSDEKLTLPMVRAGQRRNINMVDESGLYVLIFQSRKPEARAFRKWITRDVLPAIRQRGSYTQFPKGLRYTTLNGRRMYPFRQLCIKVTGHAGGSYYAYRKRYPGQFAEFDSVVYCSEEVGRQILLNRGIRDNRELLANLPPVLPPNFGEPILFPLNNGGRLGDGKV